MTEIAATAILDKTAQLGSDVYIGPGCVIDSDVIIGDGCLLKANIFVSKGVTLGQGNQVFPNCVLGEEPQMVDKHDPETELIIGNDNVFRENVTINRGSPIGSGKTIIGDQNYFMIGSHVGHDCEIEDNVVLGNYCQIGGHGKLERNVWMSAFCGTHQFVTVGRFVYAGGLSGIVSDIPPFMRTSGSYPCTVRGLNAVGLQRAGFSAESIQALNETYRGLYRHREGALTGAVEEMMSRQELDENVKYLLEFLQRSFQHRMNRHRELFRH